MSPGFHREELVKRYGVPIIKEDAWHAHSGQKTSAFLNKHLQIPNTTSGWVLNAGAGAYDLSILKQEWRQIPLDLFVAPITGRNCGICASIEHLPFHDGVLDGIVCVGEVLSYCNPATAIREFARVLVRSGVLICDFGSSKSIRHWLTSAHGRAADIITDNYNGTPERVWIYDPAYIENILVTSGFEIREKSGTHTWSALTRRLGVPLPMTLYIQEYLEWLKFPTDYADLMTISAVRGVGGK